MAAQDSNEPYELVLTRVVCTKALTSGQMHFQNKMIYTLELPWKDNQRNISCIPYGTYPLKVHFSPKFKRKVIRLLDVPDRDYIYFHAANYISQLKGCIGVGLDIELPTGLLFSARKAEQQLFSFVANLLRSKPVILTITQIKGGNNETRMENH